MSSETSPPIRRALISVSDKTGIVDLAQSLANAGVEILSTGGTARFLSDHGIPVLEVATYTDFPELMAGRVKTLHPRIYGGILGRRGLDDRVMEQHAIPPIDLVVVNLYPFEETVARPDCSLDEAIENIDIGGPALIRAAAKNHVSVTVIVDPEDYDTVVQSLASHGGAVDGTTRFALATKAFAYTARYDGAIVNYLGSFNGTQARTPFPSTLNLQFIRSQAMRYGENPHQRAAFYVQHRPSESSLATARQLQGKSLSYNNVVDSDAALECIKSFTKRSACVIVKHGNPCGVALADTLWAAYDRAFRTDPTSAFGGIIAFNRPLDVETARSVIERQFVELIIAPEIHAQALPILAAKKNVRVLACGDWSSERPSALDFKRVTGGLLVQDRDLDSLSQESLKVVTQRSPSPQQRADLQFAWTVAKFVKSNAIVYCRDGATVGIGAGQMSRVYSARIAALKATDEGLDVQGSVMASDAFFPFRDSIDAAAEVGITAVIQPGGSMRDEEVIAAADEHDMAMVFTGVRHFRH